MGEEARKRDEIGSIPQVEETVRVTGSCLMAGKTGKEEYARLLGELFAIEEEEKDQGHEGAHRRQDLMVDPKWGSIGDCHIPLTG